MNHVVIYQWFRVPKYVGTFVSMPIASACGWLRAKAMSAILALFLAFALNPPLENKKASDCFV